MTIYGRRLLTPLSTTCLSPITSHYIPHFSQNTCSSPSGEKDGRICNFLITKEKSVITPHPVLFTSQMCLSQDCTPYVLMNTLVNITLRNNLCWLTISHTQYSTLSCDLAGQASFIIISLVQFTKFSFVTKF